MSSISAVHEIIYSSFIDPVEEKRLESLGVAEVANYATIARRMIMQRERAEYPTPFSVRFGSSEVRFHQIEDFIIALDVADPSVSIPVMRDGEFEPDLTNCFHKNVKSGMRVVDVGANIGFFTLLAARLVGSSAHREQ